MKKKGWREFIALCRHVRSEDELQALFGFFFTLDEQDQLAMRVELVRALLKGDKPQRAIADDLKISIAKITRGSNALKTIGPELRRYLMSQLL